MPPIRPDEPYREVIWPGRQRTQPLSTWKLILRLGLVTAALAAVLLLDLVLAASWPLLLQGLLDESAHLLTAWLCLSALGAPLVPGLRERWVLAGTVLIDLDHLPLYVHHEGWAVDGGRPPTHSLGLLLLLLLLAVSIPRWRTAVALLAAGLLFHLVRDLATGPGVPLFWPFGSPVLIPYSVYVAVLVVAAIAAVLRGLSRSARGPSAVPAAAPERQRHGVGSPGPRPPGAEAQAPGPTAGQR